MERRASKHFCIGIANYRYNYWTLSQGLSHCLDKESKTTQFALLSDSLSHSPRPRAPTAEMPPPSQRRRRTANPADEDDDEPRRRQTRRNDSDDDAEESAHDEEGDMSMAGADGSDEQQLVKKLVRYALACEYARLPIKRDGIREKVLGNNGRSFKRVFDGAQHHLRQVFGMELSELPSREKRTLKEKQSEIFPWPPAPIAFY